MEEHVRDQSREAQSVVPEQRPAELKTPASFPVKGASYLRANVPLPDLPADAAAELASRIGNSAFLELLVGGNGFESISFSLQAPWPGKENRIKTSAPSLTDPAGLIWAENLPQPFPANSLRDRADHGVGLDLSGLAGAANE